jgi:ribosomal protein L32E
MSKNGFLKVKIHSIEGLSSLDPECIVKMIAGDVSIASTNSLIDKNKHRAFYLPISDKIQL